MLKLEKKYDSLPWLTDIREHLEGLSRAGQCPHGLLIQGRAGSGRRQLALWLAEAILGVDPSRLVAGSGDEEAGHPDFRTVELEINKDTKKLKRDISIDQIRDLISYLTLTSHSSKGRVVIIYPADSMNRNAANSLLKTLEEPPANTVIVLISESLTKLPATIISRCQRIRVPAANTSEAAAWLSDQAEGADLTGLLDFSGGAPLAALGLHQRDFGKLAREFAGDLQALEQRRSNPVAVAGRWKAEPELALQWLYWSISGRIRESLEGAGGNQDEGFQRGLQAGFRQLGQIRELRRLINGGINAELSLAELLMDWYGGLGHQ